MTRHRLLFPTPSSEGLQQRANSSSNALLWCTSYIILVAAKRRRLKISQLVSNDRILLSRCFITALIAGQILSIGTSHFHVLLWREIKLRARHSRVPPGVLALASTHHLRVLLEGLPLVIVTVAIARFGLPSTAPLLHLDLATAARIDRLVGTCCYCCTRGF